MIIKNSIEIFKILIIICITWIFKIIKNSVSLFCLLSSLATILLVYNYRRMKVVLIMEKIMSMIIMDKIMIYEYIHADHGQKINMVPH